MPRRTALVARFRAHGSNGRLLLDAQLPGTRCGPAADENATEYNGTNGRGLGLQQPYERLPCRIRLDLAGFLDGFGWFWLCRWRLRASAPPLRAPFQASERSGSVPPHTAAPCQRVLRDYRTVPEAAESIQAWLWCTTHGRMQGMEESTGPQLQAVYIVDLDQNLSFQ